MTIVGLGEALWDIYGDDKYIGGAPANFACDAAQLGHSVTLVSRVGNDRMGEELIGALKVKGVGTSYIQRDFIKATGRVRIKLKKGAIPSFCCIRDAAYDYIEMNSRLEKLAKKAEVVLFGNLAQRNEVSRKAMYRFLDPSPAPLKIFDFNYRSRKLPEEDMITGSLERTTVLKADKREWRILKKILNKSDETNGTVFSSMKKDFGIAFTCVSLGRGGCVISTGDDCIYSPGFKIKPVDTTGAGDAFMCGFVDAYLEKKNLEEIARWSNAFGAYVALRNGASPHFSRSGIENFLAEHTRRVSIEKYKNLDF